MSTADRAPADPGDAAGRPSHLQCPRLRELRVGQQEADVTTERLVMLPLSQAEAWKLVELIELADEEELIFDKPTIRDIYAALRRRLIPVDPDRHWRVL